MPQLIPNHTPIQSYVLSDDVDEDEPLHVEQSSSSEMLISTSVCTTHKERSEKRKAQTLKHKIPKLPTELEPSSSSSSTSAEEDNPDGEIVPNIISDGEISEENSIVSIDQLRRMDKRQYSTASTDVDYDNEPIVHSFQIADLEEVPHGIPRQSTTMKNYQFPTHRLKKRLSDANKYPLVIVACGSFSPITYLHLRMFEMALDSIRESTKFEVIGGFYSPVSDNYSKPGLAPSSHRVRMCELACERTSSWLMVDAWESLQPKYTRTALVLDHFNREINIKRGGVFKAGSSTEKIGVKVMLLAGGDLIESMGEPNVWADQDMHHILGNYGCLIVERTGSDVRSFLLSHDIMYEHRKNILVIKQMIYNDISSTKVRLFIRRNMSVRYLLPNSVIRYIQENHLYVNDKEPVKVVLNK
ncbi:Nicotinamide/nicotinic acid mononucleotide adenylyltransferase 1 [Brettanomyces nanus]|uniref:Nicotinamide-nucleotide adenylyltransferase n=1 Tax=Eeniella nana TaxID=13502 RepID=A0A875S867_EENNA|nr:Nicotinamide/nicotinic acid mononucleotide adenylyltransferase 1 [Brettanomyces nanus]QPG75324.1 Nicotinamide/nicotinic acid mononucleotide adenylyltransferase 1 [Brettanomyces nanus]